MNMCACTRESTRFRCMHMGMCVCVCGHICRAPPWTHEARDSEWALPARLGKEAGTAVGFTGHALGMSWGSGHTDHRNSRLWASYSPPEAWEGLAGPKGCRRSSVPWDTPSLLALCWHSVRGFTLPRNKVVQLSGGLEESSQQARYSRG